MLSWETFSFDVSAVLPRVLDFLKLHSGCAVPVFDFPWLVLCYLNPGRFINRLRCWCGGGNMLHVDRGKLV